MSKIFVTGSADGLGQLAAKMLIEEGHQVVLHARNARRAEDALRKVPGAKDVLVADLSDIEKTKKLAAESNTLGSFDAVIHNAGVFHTSSQEIFRVNTLAPYILTCLMCKPERLIYMSSQMHLRGNPDLDNFERGQASYSDSKLHDVILAKAVARKWPDVYSNAVDPGWVPTKMGGAGAPDDLRKGYETQVWLAAGEDANASGRYFFHRKESQYAREADHVGLQEKLIALCEKTTGVRFPE